MDVDETALSLHHIVVSLFCILPIITGNGMVAEHIVAIVFVVNGHTGEKLIHSGEKPFVCKQCNYSSADASIPVTGVSNGYVEVQVLLT